MDDVNLYNFLLQAYRLKSFTRRSAAPEIVINLSDGTIVLEGSNSESVAAHCWGTLLLATVWHASLSDKLQKRINLQKVVQMLIVHDLGESLTGDIALSTYMNNKELLENKSYIEAAAVNRADRFGVLPNLKKLVIEFEGCKTLNAKFAKLCDALDWSITQTFAPDMFAHFATAEQVRNRFSSFSYPQELNTFILYIMGVSGDKNLVRSTTHAQ